MLKSKLKLLIALLIAIIMILSSFSSCLATDAEATDDETTNTVTDETDDVDESTDESIVEDESTTTEDSLIESDLYLYELSDVVITDAIDGNAFIVGTNVTISSQIGGDVFVFADTVTIDGGYIYSNLFVFANNLIVSGIIYDLYACADTVTITSSGYVYRDLHVVANTLNLLGAVGRNAEVASGNILFTNDSSTTSHGVVYGDLKYTSDYELTIDESYVEGDIVFSQSISVSSGTTITSYIFSLLTNLIFVLIIFLLVMWLAPKFMQNSKELLSKKTLSVIGFGILTLILIPIITFILIFTTVATTLSIALIFLYTLLLIISSSIFIISISGIVANKLKADSKWKQLGIALVVTIVIYLLELIPYLGGFVTFATVVLGLGILVRNVLPSSNKESEVTK